MFDQYFQEPWRTFETSSFSVFTKADISDKPPVQIPLTVIHRWFPLVQLIRQSSSSHPRLAVAVSPSVPNLGPNSIDRTKNSCKCSTPMSYVRLGADSAKCASQFKFLPQQRDMFAYGY